MEHRSVLQLSAREDCAPYTVVVEPWAEEFVVAPGAECRGIFLNPSAPPTFDVELYHGKLVVSVFEGRSTFEFWRGDAREAWRPIPTPDWPA